MRADENRKVAQPMDQANSAIFKSSDKSSGFFLALTLSLATFYVSSTQAQEARVRPVAPKVIDEAISAYVTQRGEKSLSHNIKSMLAESGFSPDRGFFETLKLSQSKPISLDQLAHQNPASMGVVLSLKEILKQWFVGIELQDPNIKVSLKDIRYQAEIKSMSLATDAALHEQIAQRLGKKSGVVLVFEAVVGQIRVDAHSVMLQDSQNPYLGTFGIVAPNLVVNQRGGGLKLRLPVYVDVAGNGVSIEELPYQENLADLDLQLSYKSLVTPDIELEINGHKFPMNKQKLVTSFDSLKPQLLSSLKNLVQQTLHENLGGLGQSKAAQVMTGAEQLTQLSPPGRPARSNDPDLVWGLKVTSIEQGRTVTGVKLSSFIEDPRRANVELNPTAGARGKVSLAGSNIFLRSTRAGWV
jgi:hypothetical protein